MFKTNSIQVIVGILLGLSFAGCGNGNDPLQMMDNPLPPLNSITATSFSNGYLQGSFNANTPYWVFTSSFASAAANYTAPASGMISEIGVSYLPGVQGYYVTIVHSGRLSSRILGLQNPSNMRIGDPVLTGQVISSYFNTGFVGFQVLLDGVPVCPLSYLSSQFRSGLSVFNTQLCQ